MILISVLSMVLLAACGVEENPGDEIQVTIYYRNVEEGFLNRAQVNLERLPPEYLWQSLWEELVVRDEGLAEVVATSFSLIDNAGGTITLNLSENFQTVLRNSGADLELLLVASVVNTFLSAYDAEVIRITAGGYPLESGHNDFSGLLRRFIFRNGG